MSLRDVDKGVDIIVPLTILNRIFSTLFNNHVT